MAGLHVCADRMVRVWKSLSGTWDNTREQWKDKDQQLFEHEHIQEIANSTNAYIGSLRQLAEHAQRIQGEAP